MAQQFKVLFHDRLQTPGEIRPCSCGMTTCASTDISRGVHGSIEALNKRDAWDRLHQRYPYERISILADN